MTRLVIAVALAATLSPAVASAWGDRTHPAIARLAIDTLPEDVSPAFRARQVDLERYSNEPDNLLRARDGREEAIRHFIDLDGYMAAPFDGFPRTFDAAVTMIGKRKVEKYGVLPWTILRKRRELAMALASGDDDWVRIAGHLAHYVGDAYQPLHLTVDYDGQKSGAKGIHRRFENDVVDAQIRTYEESIRPRLRRAVILVDPRESVFQALFRSYGGYRPIIDADRLARRAGRPRSRAYSRALEAETRDLTQVQLEAAAVMLGSMWLTSVRESGGESRGSKADPLP